MTSLRLHNIVRVTKVGQNIKKNQKNSCLLNLLISLPSRMSHDCEPRGVATFYQHPLSPLIDHHTRQKVGHCVYQRTSSLHRFAGSPFNVTYQMHATIFHSSPSPSRTRYFLLRGSLGGRNCGSVAQLSRRGSRGFHRSPWIHVERRRLREDVDAWIALLNFAQRKRFSNSDRADEL